MVQILVIVISYIQVGTSNQWVTGFHRNLQLWSVVDKTRVIVHLYSLFHVTSIQYPMQCKHKAADVQLELESYKKL